jgi:hypothetical protein
MNAQNETPDQSGTHVKDEARQVWADAKSVAQSAAGSQQKAAAQGLGDFAGALRQAARNSNDGNATSSRVAETIADNLDRVSSSLKNRSLDSLVRDVENFARAQPLVFFGAAVATGFVAMRFLKSSGPSTDASMPERMSQSSSNT